MKVLDRGFFAPGFHRLGDGLDRVEVCCGYNYCRYKLFSYLSLRPSSSARNKISNMKKEVEKQKKKKKG